MIIGSDHELSLLRQAWGWLFSLFFVPEILANVILGSPAMKPFAQSPHFRHLAALGGCINITLLMVSTPPMPLYCTLRIEMMLCGIELMLERTTGKICYML